MFFCKHDWKVLNTHIVPCTIEVFKRLYPDVTRKVFYPDEYAEIHHISYSCEKCGKLKLVNLETIGRNNV